MGTGGRDRIGDPQTNRNPEMRKGMETQVIVLSINWNLVIVALTKIVILAMILERGLALIFEYRWF